MHKQSLAVLMLGIGILLTGAGCSKTTPLVQTDAMINTDHQAMNDDGAMMEHSPSNETGAAMTAEKKMAEDSMTKDTGTTPTGAMMEKKTESNSETMKNAGSYEEYSADKLALAKNGPAVLFFKASWCPTCQAVDKDILAHLSAIPNNTTILKVDYDTSAELKKKYGVTYQHTFVQVDAEGKMIKKWSGSPTLAALTAEIQ